jgi:hypothetical protein
MLFCQFAQAHSLREIYGGLACCLGKLTHLGIPCAPKKSTLAYANEHRPWQLYETLFGQLLARCPLLAAGKEKFGFRNKLYSMDSSVIDLCLSMFDWAKFRQTKGAVDRRVRGRHLRVGCRASPRVTKTQPVGKGRDRSDPVGRRCRGASVVPEDGVGRAQGSSSR